MENSIFAVVSLDGFITRLDGQLDWRVRAGNGSDNDTFGRTEFLKSVSTVVMGRRTFLKCLAETQWPYPHQRVVVLTKTLKEAPKHLAEQVQLFDGSVEDLAIELDADGESRVFLDGGKAAQQFLQAGLVDDITIMTAPVLLGEGMPLFAGPLKKDMYLSHVETQAYDNGFVQTTYLCNYSDE
ncbi:dihydrofolate reductase family protein [Reinekea sp.]|jgi:dihydrofolate reductase|uniref:dihydrofolate reductase family protein n=1 Tax=Reinekea sp. TaxID=1970455 RepID=UPI0039892161